MPDVASDRNLLFAMFALQMDFISRDQFVEAMNAWIVNRSRSMESILLENNFCSEKRCQLLDPLVNEHIAQHGGDATRSVEALRSSASSTALQFGSDGDVYRRVTAPGHEEQQTQAENYGQTIAPTPDSSKQGVAIRYHILRPHAKGGLGEVFVARDSELNRDVALKEIQSQHAYKEESRSRFLIEAEITGGLEHPGIIPVYGLGQYADGRPFYAMRFISGDSLRDAIVDFHSRDWKSASGDRMVEFRSLLGRFIDVCQAMEYAHSRGILHRDIKPGNIMLGRFGETLIVDWGLAKQLGEAGDNSDHNPLIPMAASGTAQTVAGSALGTPQFMSPEQAQGKIAELGHATDIYGLGATLYMLLTGKAPFEQEEVSSILRKVRRGEFLRPREVLATVPAPLEAICLKAMALLPRDRHLSCQTLAKDIECWLADEPVLAFQEPWVLRARRWIRKHPAATTGVAATLMVGLIASAIAAGIVSDKNRTLDEQNQRLDVQNHQLDDNNRQLANLNQELNRTNTKLVEAHDVAVRNEREAQRQRSLAEERRKEAEEQRVIARSERDAAVAVRNFLRVDLLRQSNPWVQSASVKGKAIGTNTSNPTIRELLDRASAELTLPNLEKKFPGQTPVQVEILTTVAESYLAIREEKKAIELLQSAVAITARQYGAEHRQTLTARTLLFSAYLRAQELADASLQFLNVIKGVDAKFARATEIARNSPAEAERFFSEGITLLDAVQKCVEDQIDDLPVPDVLVVKPLQLPMVLFTCAQARPIARRIQIAVESRNGKDDHRAMLMRICLAFFDELQGKPDIALKTFQQCQEGLARKLGKDSLWTIVPLVNVIRIQTDRKEYAAAIANYDILMRQLSNHFGPAHPQVLSAIRGLADVYRRSGNNEKAISLFREAYEKQKRTLGPDHRLTLDTLIGLCDALEQVDRYSESAPLFEQAIAQMAKKFGPDNVVTLNTMNSLALTYEELGKYDKAAALHERGIEGSGRTLGVNHPDTLVSMNSLARIYRLLGQSEKSISLYQKTLELRRDKLGPDHSETLLTMLGLAAAYKSAGQHEKAIALYRDVLEKRTAKHGPDGLDTLQSMSNLASAYKAAGQLEKSIPLYEEVLARRTSKLGATHRDTLQSMSNLASAYSAANQKDKSILLYKQTLEKRKAVLPANHADILASLNNLALEYEFLSQMDKAAPILEQLHSAQSVKLGADHLTTLATSQRLALAYSSTGKADKALPILEHAWKIRTAKLGPDHAETLRTQHAYATILAKAGNEKEAERLFADFVTRSPSVKPATLDSAPADAAAKSPGDSKPKTLDQPPAKNSTDNPGGTPPQKPSDAKSTETKLVRPPGNAAMSRTTPAPNADLKLRITALDWLIAYHDKNHNKPAADKYRTLRAGWK